MRNIKFLVIIAFLCLVLFASLPGNISSGDTAMSLRPEQESLLPNPYHPNDILQAPAGLSPSASDNPTDQYTLNVYYVVPSDIAPDPDVLAEMMVRVLAIGENEYSKLETNCLNSNKEYSLEEVCKKLVKIYESVSNN